MVVMPILRRRRVRGGALVGISIVARLMVMAAWMVGLDVGMAGPAGQSEGEPERQEPNRGEAMTHRIEA